MSLPGILLNKSLGLVGLTVVRRDSLQTLLRELRKNRRREMKAKAEHDKLRRTSVKRKRYVRSFKKNLEDASKANRELRKELAKKDLQVELLERELRDAVQGELDRLFSLAGGGER